jgi:hypothetical protein
MSFDFWPSEEPRELADLEYMQSVGFWPHVNILAIKKGDEIATLRYFSDDTFGLYEGIPLHDVEAILNEENPRMLEPTELDKLVEEGWKVDR